jgi:hypothetical protein
MSDDPIRKWREDAEQREEERARVKRERLRAERRDTEGQEPAALRGQFEARLNSLETRLVALEQHNRESCSNACWLTRADPRAAPA